MAVSGRGRKFKAIPNYKAGSRGGDRRRSATFYRQLGFKKTVGRKEYNPPFDFLEIFIDKPDVYVGGFEAFYDYFYALLIAVSENLAKGGVTTARRALLAAETPWGQARMSGEYYGTSFPAYGKGPGRYDTGNMYEALSWYGEGSNQAPQSFNPTAGFFFSFGYDKTKDRSPRTRERPQGGGKYFERQERGFLNTSSFSPADTQANGRASFRSVYFARAPQQTSAGVNVELGGGRPKRTRGAFALPAAAQSIEQRFDAAMSAAWNQAKQDFIKSGGNASRIPNYLQARATANKIMRMRKSENYKRAAGLR